MPKITGSLVTEADLNGEFTPKSGHTPGGNNSIMLDCSSIDSRYYVDVDNYSDNRLPSWDQLENSLIVNTFYRGPTVMNATDVYVYKESLFGGCIIKYPVSTLSSESGTVVFLNIGQISKCNIDLYGNYIYFPRDNGDAPTSVTILRLNIVNFSIDTVVTISNVNAIGQSMAVGCCNRIPDGSGGYFELHPARLFWSEYNEAGKYYGLTGSLGPFSLSTSDSTINSTPFPRFVATKTEYWISWLELGTYEKLSYVGGLQFDTNHDVAYSIYENFSTMVPCREGIDNLTFSPYPPSLVKLNENSEYGPVAFNGSTISSLGDYTLPGTPPWSGYVFAEKNSSSPVNPYIVIGTSLYKLAGPSYSFVCSASF